MNINTLKPAVAFLANKIGIEKSEIQLTPHGKFNARDGRPASCKFWQMNAQIASRIIANLSKRKSQIAIDYEHQTLKTDKNGQPAPAAGWFLGANVVYREGKGLFATNVEWTPAALKQIQDKAYRYISPVIIYDPKTGEILDLYNAALTNDPAIDGMDEVTIAAASSNIIDYLTNTHGDKKMNEILALLRKLLGLDAEATEEQILQVLQQIESDTASAAASNLLVLIGGKDKQIAELGNQITALKALKEKEIGAEKTAVAELSKKVAELSLQVSTDKKAVLIKDALANGKLIPSMIKWAESITAEALSAYLEHAPVVADLSNQTKSKIPTESQYGLSDIEIEAAKLSGLTPKEYAEAKKEQTNGNS